MTVMPTPLPTPMPTDPHADATAKAGAGAGAGACADAGASSDSCNDNSNCNGNDNHNTNVNCTDVDVKDKVTVDVKACVDAGPPSETNSCDTNSFNQTTTTDTTTYNLNLANSPINLADATNFFAGGGDNFSFTGGGTDTVFHVDQVNGLIANNSLSGVGLTNNSGFTQYANDLNGGEAHSGSIDGTVGDTVSGSISSAASATASLSAFTQNIVLGANIQYNSLTQSVVGHDIGHTTTATLDPGHVSCDLAA